MALELLVLWCRKESQIQLQSLLSVAIGTFHERTVSKCFCQLNTPRKKRKPSTNSFSVQAGHLQVLEFVEVLKKILGRNHNQSES